MHPTTKSACKLYVPFKLNRIKVFIYLVNIFAEWTKSSAEVRLGSANKVNKNTVRVAKCEVPFTPSHTKWLSTGNVWFDIDSEVSAAINHASIRMQ